MRTLFTSVNYSVFKYASTLSRSSSLNMSEYAGMPLPPALMIALMFASVGFLPFFSLSFLVTPFSPGPIFFSSLSALWHTAQLSSKMALPFSASPAGGAAKTRPPIMRAAARQLVAMIPFFIPSSLQSPHMALQIGDKAPEIKSGDFQLSKLKGKRVVLFFYPKSDTPGCTKEACEFRDLSKKFDKKETMIVGLSPA